MIWDHAIDSAYELDLTRPRGKFPDRLHLSATRYFLEVRTFPFKYPTSISLLWVCRMSRQILLEVEDWKRIYESLQTSWFGWESDTELLEDVKVELERLKN